MRLLNTSSLEIENFLGSKVPRYAILSHRWGDDEVSLQEFRCLTEPDEGRRALLQQVWNVPDSKRESQGFKKIKRVCAVALDHHYEWVWIDTCCINKESSAELSEAINSMFKWYMLAAICIAYLSDVRMSDAGVEDAEIQGLRPFVHSDWFTRGWTLQELLAPRRIEFLGADYELLGTKATLETELAMATGISSECIGGRKSIWDESVATRMSWAAHRTTTRTEDIAYCLLGIFSINMPLLYGEGSRAFRRLQEEIIKSSDDQTIFAHTQALHTSPKALAHNPRNFASHYKVHAYLPVRFKNTLIGTPSFTVTNKGVQIRAPLLPISDDGSLRGFLLACHFEGQDYPVIIPVAPASEGDLDAVKPSFANSYSTWRIRVHTSFEDDIKKVKGLIDFALKKAEVGQDPFEDMYWTIYLR
jgi:Heterokaryon incompatibility protein (HET)